ncbi:MAG: ACP S-malonyltransferase [Bacteroidetes bacterium]|nr:ACP S-malonyltransferase [Bacteroidota bacterium]
MKTALVFPGQGSQAPGMGKALYDRSPAAKALFDAAPGILGFDIVKIMFEGTEEELKQTSVTQPAIFIHSVAVALTGGFEADMTAGHSLGEFSALVAAGVLTFEEGLHLVSIRANAMQKACDAAPSTMAAIVGIDDAVVEQVCASIDDIVVPANYNTIGQLVISGSESGVDLAIEKAKAAGAKIAKRLVVNGAFHSPFMQPAAEELAKGIHAANFKNAQIPVYQNFTALPETDKEKIKANLIAQLTGPVRWTQTVENMIKDGAGKFIECGPGKVLAGFIKRVDKTLLTENFD